ncbi:MAG TPA: DNA polymerase/3'-5' exonuclease PolX, partial [Abditibacteriaceae bacterium]
MQNAAVSQMFEDIADLLEIAGENVFQIRAYRRAAEAVATHTTPIEDMAAANELRGISGLGPATSDKVKEFLATGRVAFLEKLREEYPPGLVELLRVPGLGPKKVTQLYRERGISNVEQLQEAIENGELAGLSGFGPKTITNIQSGIRRLGEMSSQLPLYDALPLAHLIKRTLEDVPGVQNVEISGDLRRGAETLSSLEWVAQASDNAAVIAAFLGLPQLQEITEQSETRVAIRIRPGIDAILHLASANDYGNILFLSTGSPAHIEAAPKKLSSLDDATFATEAEVYAALGTDYIEPELRENTGEWALKVQPNLVQIADIKGDLHAHSNWSDGSASIRQMVEAAQARGYLYHAITDHSKALAMANGLDAKRLREQAKEIEEVQAEFPGMKILRGVECDILRDGSLDLDDDILHELDWVVASVHSAFNLDEATQTARMIRAISHPAVDLIGHPTGRIVGARPAYEVDVAALIEAAREFDTALEINASQRLDLKDVHARAARDAGVLLSIDTDAHSTRMLGNLQLGILTARRAWCEPAHVLNTKT